MLKCFIALYFFVCSFNLFAVKPINYGYKSFIISFSKPSSKEALNEIPKSYFTVFEALNPEHTIFKVTCNSSLISAQDAEELLYKLPNILMVQEDSPVQLRTTFPNDTFLSSQWHLNKIKAPQAWDLTKGGVNRRGDTIVLAIVDDGLNINHPDFKGNLWINYADIAGNGIDDDGNGFIDDHYGWNFMSDNNDISDSGYYAGGHGTPVSGIVGATGNNRKGITGILWYVKLMIVNVRDTTSMIGANFAFQSDVIRAYSYVLHQRKLYNATKGAKGAFVVGINTSWGIDRKFAYQAPIWCAFYDSLGKYGILTAGSTSNDDIDVDDFGDLPSLCTSKHLIVVSNSDYYDNHVGSGYSSGSVDLSAPGQGIFTTAAYIKGHLSYEDGFSGTSAATPMVTGAIGLLHAYACQKMMNLIVSNPEQANLLMRRFILEGVDVIPALAGKNATNGRLNVYKAMQIMDQYCREGFPSGKSIILYPNPGNGVVYIESVSDIVSVTCFDITGQRIACAVKFNEIDISQLASGVYSFRVETTDGMAVLPYVKLSE